MKLFLATCVLFALGNTASACSAPNLGPRYQKTIPVTPDQDLFSQAVLVATNFERCKVGKSALRNHGTVQKAALLHSRNMARTRTFNHKTRAGGAQTLKDRANKVRLRWRWIGENIALLSRYQFGHNKQFEVIDRSACQFLNPKTKTTIPAHTYASLAVNVVEQWMASDGHRKNIQSRYAGRMSAALVFDGSGDTCGKFYITQVFAD